MLGGYLISLIEVLGSYFLMKKIGLWIGSYRMLIPLTFMSIFLMFEPGGLSSFIDKVITSYRRRKIMRRMQHEI